MKSAAAQLRHAPGFGLWHLVGTGRMKAERTSGADVAVGEALARKAFAAASGCRQAVGTGIGVIAGVIRMWG